MPVEPLRAEDVTIRIDPAALTFETTAELPDLDFAVGQDRALEALTFGAGIQQKGYNMFVTGAPGAGRHVAVRSFLDRVAAALGAPCDWAYVYDFDNPRKPKALRLESGVALALRDTMRELIDDLRTAIPPLFESEDYRGRRRAVDAEVNKETGEAFAALNAKAEPQGFALVNTQGGPAILPVKDGKVMEPDEFNALADVDARVQSMRHLREELDAILAKAPVWERRRRDLVRELNRDMVRRAIAPLMQEAKDRVIHSHAAQTYLAGVDKDIVDHIELFLRDQLEGRREPEGAGAGSGSGPSPQGPAQPPEQNQFWRYAINVLVTNSPAGSAPVIYEPHPTLANLVGRVELVAQFGTLVTDFSMIRAGALHRAYGGFLLLDAAELLSQPMAWDALKRALRRETVVIESIDRAAGVAAAVSIDPDPVPLNVKLVLFGDRMLHALLRARDPDFADLFKVQVDFSETIAMTPANQEGVTRLIAAIARRGGLRPLDRTGAARALEEAVRLAGDRRKLSLMVSGLADMLREADHVARDADAEAVTAAHVQAALDAQERRVALPKERAAEMIETGSMLLDLDGAKVGQVNGLSVLDLGQMAFGRPARITARVRAGAGKVIDIEREAELGGRLHSKGVLILSGYLGAHYLPDEPLGMVASLVFEQSYGGVDGDSATLAELLALVSALAQTPLKQSLAVTGSLNQWGEVQPIGGATEKVEGFFDACAKRGLTGGQGVVLPQANVPNLVLNKNVTRAVSEGKFRLWPVRHCDEAIELFTGQKAGERGKAGFPRGTVNRKVADRLAAFAASARRTSKKA
jgi:lon-related putative ATP-dependent protease